MARVLLFGQAQFGERTLAGLLERGHDVLAACVPPDRDGRPADPLKAAAEAAGVPVIQRKSYRSAEAFAEVAAERADIGVLAFVTQIIPAVILDAPRRASVCFHPSLLPAYRGGSAINWQLIHGETRGGITLFRPDDRIDAGPIYLKKEIEIGLDDSAGSFYYARVFEPGIEATLEAVDLVLGDKEGVPQNEADATHDPLCRDEHAGIDWSQPTSVLHNLIRGCDPAPGAHAVYEGKRLRFYGSRTGASGRVDDPGTVVAVGEQGIEIATGDGTLVLGKMAAGGKKVTAAEAADEIDLAAGAHIEPAVRSRGV